MIAPRLTRGTDGSYDLLLEDGNFAMATDGTQVAQHVMQRLLIFKGELSLNGELTTKTELGTKWYEIIFAMDVPQSEKELELKNRIMDTPGVLKILRFTWIQSGYTVTIDADIQTEWGTETISQEITPL